MIVFQCFSCLECRKNVSLLSQFDKLTAGCFGKLTAGSGDFYNTFQNQKLKVKN